MRYAVLVLVAACTPLVLVAACTPSPGTGAPPPYATGPAPRAAASAPADACPLTVEGVSADIEHTGRGATVTLVGPPDQLMLLRARARGVGDVDGGLLAACPCAALA